MGATSSLDQTGRALNSSSPTHQKSQKPKLILDEEEIVDDIQNKRDDVEIEMQQQEEDLVKTPQKEGSNLHLENNNNTPQESPVILRLTTTNSPKKKILPEQQQLTLAKSQSNIQDAQMIEVHRRNSDFAIVAWFKQASPFFKDREKAQYKAGRQKVKEQLSVQRITKKLRELDRLKTLLLDENQRVVFDNLPKPDVMAPLDIPNAIERQFALDSRKLTIPENTKRVHEIYSAIANKPQKSRIDQRLMYWYETGDY